MPKRLESILKIFCLGMGALLLWQLGTMVWRGDPLAHVIIPELPSLPGDTNTAAKPPAKDTNALAMVKAPTSVTNGTNRVTLTNAVNATNRLGSTNQAASTNMPGTNRVVGSSNLVTLTNIESSTNASNSVARGPRRGRGASGASAVPVGMTPDMMDGMSPDMMAQMGGGPRGRGGKKMEIPPEVQARIDKIISSELLGPVIHPMPMALLGISDDQAFLRATNGQTGPVKLGKEMGGIKLLAIGVNRVLVEADGEKKELTLFDGIGGESLMPKTTDAAAPDAAPPKSAAKTVTTNSSSTNRPRSSKPKESQ